MCGSAARFVILCKEDPDAWLNGSMHDARAVLAQYPLGPDGRLEVAPAMARFGNYYVVMAWLRM